MTARTLDLLASAHPRHNAAKIRHLMETETRDAVRLYRTIEDGPSGQRTSLCVGRVEFRPFGEDDFAIRPPDGTRIVGYARRVERGEWSITEDRDTDGVHWLGYASSLAVGVDVLVNGEHAALRRHGARRTSSGSLRRGPGHPH